MRTAEESELKYVLIVKDDISSFTWPCLCDDVDSDSVKNILPWCISCFGGTNWLVTDQGSSFNTSLKSNLTIELHIKHQFTPSYCPWLNGTVERACKEVLRIIRASLSEWRLSVRQWPSLFNVVKKIINKSPVERLGTNKEGKLRCPMKVFLGLKLCMLVIRPLPLRRYRDLNLLTEKRCMQVVNMRIVHLASDQVQRS